MELIRKIFTPGEFYFFHMLAFVALFAMNMVRAKYYKIKVWQSVVLTVLIYSFGYLLMLVMCWVESGFKNWGAQNIVRIFAWLPVIALPVAKILKLKWRGVSDFVAPCLCINHGIAHFGCINAGCCGGYPCSWGIYNPITESRLFPIQPIEAVTALIITAILIIWDRKRGYRQDGKVYAFMLLMFGPTRFIWEFFRNNTKLFWGISALALHALFMTIVGIIAWFCFSNRSERESREEKYRLRREKQLQNNKKNKT